MHAIFHLSRLPFQRRLRSAVAAVVLLATFSVQAAEVVEFQKHVAPVLNKYCVGCHSDAEGDGGLSLQSYSSLLRGGEHGAALTPGNPLASRMIRLARGIDEPQMPPEDEPQPTASDIDILANWIEQGAKGPNGDAAKTMLSTPRIATKRGLNKPVTSLDWSPQGFLAIGKFGRVEIRPADAEIAVPLGNFPGKVTSVRFSRDGQRLVTTSGVTGLSGWAGVWDAKTGKLLKEFRGHYDVIQTGALSPDGTLLATGSYDRRILIWNVATGEVVRELAGHNGAIYDLDFNRTGDVLATASGDETVKLWRVDSGQRLDTLSQPGKEQYTVRFSPDDRFVVAGGADNRIRVWRFVSRKAAKINPLVHSRFAHEGAVTHLRFANEGKTLVSAAEDRTLKLWETSGYTQVHVFTTQSDVLGGLATSTATSPQVAQIALGRLDGQVQLIDLPQAASIASATSTAVSKSTASDMPVSQPKKANEHEPNNAVPEAQVVELPAVIHGVIDGTEMKAASDQDIYRFRARAGQTWALEVNAARNKSKLDSRIEVLSSDGAPVPQALLQAMRDSYFTFRGKDSNTSGDFRVHNWQEMELNQFLYCNGEVVRLWHYPRGPDSGFLVYPGAGNRRTYFGTSPMAHALHEPCYIVQPLPVGAKPLPNGLPLFTVFYENDDDPLRRWGADSRLTFTAPADGEYLVRITDVRGQQGNDYHYDLTIRPQRPDFSVSLGGGSPTINAGSGKEFTLTAKRTDGFEGRIEVQIDELPPGIDIKSPIVIEPHQNSARAVVWAAPDAKAPTPEQVKAIRVTASAVIHDKTVRHQVGGFASIKVGGKPKVLVRVVRSGQKEIEPDSPVELTIAPGETITAEVIAERLGYNGRISFGNHDSGRNLPHGVFVDNIGLNGLMIVEKQTRREFFITAAPFVPEQTRLFHLRTSEEGNQTSQPVLLHIRNK